MIKTHYSDGELQEFKKIILEKLERSKIELLELLTDIKHVDNTTSDTDGGHINMFEDGFEGVTREEQNIQATRLQKLIKHLENALIRIETKTYGFCRETGELISKERLMAVPHATLSIKAKQERDKLA